MLPVTANWASMRTSHYLYYTNVGDRTDELKGSNRQLAEYLNFLVIIPINLTKPATPEVCTVSFQAARSLPTIWDVVHGTNVPSRNALLKFRAIYPVVKSIGAKQSI